MTGAFDAARALRPGLGDRQQAWAFIRELAAEWTSPLVSGDGVSEAVPEHPAWYDPGVKIRWFSAPGQLLRVDGHAPRGTLMAAGQTPADLEYLRATLPGAWNSVRWPDRESTP